MGYITRGDKEIMYKKMLVPLDGSELAEVVFGSVAERVLLGVTSPILLIRPH